MMKYLPFLLFLLLKAGTATAQNNLVINGIPWFDDKGNIVNAHGACIVEENGRYYLFGEWKSDKSNARRIQNFPSGCRLLSLSVWKYQ